MLSGLPHPADVDPNFLTPRRHARIEIMATSIPQDPVFSPLVNCFTPEVALRIVNLQLDEQVQRQAQSWAERAAEGSLSEEERCEYESLIEKVDLLDLLKSLARQALKQGS